MLRAGDFDITLIYKRVLIHELVERCGMDHPVVRAVRDRAVCMVNPFSCKMLHKKASLAVLSDERNARLFSAEEAQAIAAHIPWTRVVEERKTMFGGKEVDLSAVHPRQSRAARAEAERRVRRQGDRARLGGDGRGSGRRALAAANEEPYVVQERITLSDEPYPRVIDGKLQVFDRMLDTKPFVGGRRVHRRAA